MNTQSPQYKIRLGLFVTVGFILFVLTIFLIGKQKNLFNPVLRLTTTFKNVSGLQVGNNVRFSGINIGTIGGITFSNDSTVQVEMIIKKSVQPFLKADCQATIGPEGIIGDRVLIITQGNSPSEPVRDKQSISSTEPVEMDKIIKSLHVTAGNFEVISAQLALMMVNLNNGRGTLGKLIKDSSIAENFDNTVMNFKLNSKGIVENIEEIMERMNKTIENVEKSSQHLTDLFVNINMGTGTIGRLIQDTIIAENINQTILNLKESSIGLNENMEAAKSSFFLKRYFKKKEKQERKLKLDTLKLKEDEAKSESDEI